MVKMFNIEKQQQQYLKKHPVDILKEALQAAKKREKAKSIVFICWSK